uniref:Ig-like domain-containing protein n=1 Tax=Oryzias latipes TaxID=8090 RepID=A0A3B3H9Z9_ORYLA
MYLCKFSQKILNPEQVKSIKRNKFIYVACLMLTLFYYKQSILCQFTSSHDLVYLEQVYFNKRLMVQYNSTLGKYEGYTKKAKDLADGFSKSKPFLEQAVKNREKCRTHMDLVFELQSHPVVRQGSSHQAMLACSAYNFYPKQIRLTWLRNGEKVINYVTSTEELPDGNWLYQIHSYLEYTPSPREEITCMVEHSSLPASSLLFLSPASISGPIYVKSKTTCLLNKLQKQCQA